MYNTYEEQDPEMGRMLFKFSLFMLAIAVGLLIGFYMVVG